MKKISRLVLTLALVGLCSTVSAQKFGYINSQELISVMPERAGIEQKLTTMQKELTEQMEAIQVEYNNKIQEYEKGRATWTTSVRQLKERDIQSLQQRFQEFQQTAQQDLQSMQNELMMPVIKKAEDAIAKVSKANALDAVFDVSAGALAYYNEATMKNILSLVKTELGIK